MNASDETQEPIRTEQESGGRFVDFAALMWRRRWIAFGTPIVFVVVAVIAVLVVTPRYTAYASFMAPPQEGGGVASFLRDPLSAVLGRASGATLDRLMNFVNSFRMRRMLVERYDLMAHYKVGNITYAMQSLAGATDAVVTPDGAVTIAVTDRDPVLARNLTNAYVDIVDSLYRASESFHATQLCEFLKGHVDRNEDSLNVAERRAEAFSKEHGVISLPDQVSALVDQMGTIEANIQALDVRIGAARQILGPEHYSTREMEVKRNQLIAQRKKLMDSNGRQGDDPLLSFSNVPPLALEYAKLERNVKVLSVVNGLLVQQYELAKLQEMKSISSITRIDRAVTPELKSWPRRARTVILSGIAGVVWGILLSLLADAWPGMVRRFRRAVSSEPM